MTNQAIAVRGNPDTAAIMERVMVAGDLSKLSASERVNYYTAVCNSVGLNPLTKPFEYIRLNGKLTLYARKDATEQLRKLNGVSVTDLDLKYEQDMVIVSVNASDKGGRTDSDVGAVTIGHLKGDARANAIMKAVTKSKRRVTLSICGLGWLDETEIETIPSAEPVSITDDGEIVEVIDDMPVVKVTFGDFAQNDKVEVRGKETKTGTVTGFNRVKNLIGVTIDGNGELWLAPDKLSIAK